MTSKLSLKSLSTDTKAYLILTLCCFSYFYIYLLFEPAESLFLGLSLDSNAWLSARYLGIMAMKNFSLPVWDNYFHQNINSYCNPLYPLNVVFDMIVAIFVRHVSMKTVAIFYAWFLFAHYCLMSIFFYKFLRFLKIASYASIFGAVIYTLNAYSIEKFVSPQFYISLTFAPLFLLYVFKMFSAPGDEKRFLARLVNALPFSIVFAIMISTGSVYIVMYLAFLVMIPFLVWKFFDRDISRRQFYLNLSVFLIAGLIGICIMIPAMYMQLSYVQGLDRYSFNMVGDTSFGLHPLIILLYPIFPDIFQYFPHHLATPHWAMNYWELAHYYGLSTIVFSALCILSRKRENILFFSIFILGIIYSMGIYTHINAAFYQILSLTQVNARLPVRGMFVVILSLAVLAAVGLEYFIEKVMTAPDYVRKKIKYSIISICSIIFVIQILFLTGVGLPSYMNILSGQVTKIDTTHFTSPPPFSVLSTTKEGVITTGLSISIVVLLLNFFVIVYYLIHKNQKVVKFLFVIILLFDLGAFSIKYYPPNFLRSTKSDFSNLYHVNNIVIQIESYENIENGKVDPAAFRVYDTVRRGMYVYDRELAAMTGFDYSLYLPGYRDLKHIIDQDLNSQAMDSFNIKYVFIPKEKYNELDKNKFQKLQEFPKGILLRNTAYQPRVRFADKYEVMDFDKKRWEIYNGYEKVFQKAIDDKHFVYLNSDSERTVLQKVTNEERFTYLTGPSKRTFPEITKDTKLDYKFTEYDFSSFKLSTSTSQDTILVMSELYFPKWKAEIDGQETRIYQANKFYRAILLPKGNHEVEFYYNGTQIYLAFFYAMFAFTACIAVYFIGRKR